MMSGNLYEKEGKMDQVMKSVEVNIDFPEQKFVLAEIKDGNETKGLMIKGVAIPRSGIAHGKIIQMLSGEIAKQGFTLDSRGGGKLTVDSNNKTILVHGYSSSFGQADPVVVRSLLSEVFPDFQVIIGDAGE